MGENQLRVMFEEEEDGLESHLVFDRVMLEGKTAEEDGQHLTMEWDEHTCMLNAADGGLTASRGNDLADFKIIRETQPTALSLAFNTSFELSALTAK